MPAKRKKRSKKFNHKHLIISVVIISIAMFFLFRSTEDIPIAFDIHIPSPYKICGIDVSRYQEKINWQNVAKACSGKDSLKILFAFIKATEGKSLKDPCFKHNWKNSKSNNILRG